MAYTWDDNGNLLNDGVNTYSYDFADRLLTVTDGVSTSGYAYNGDGDRLRETGNGSATDFTMDLNAGLAQVLSDGSYTYLYGNGRIAQESTSGVQYFLADALGSVRQLVDANGSVQTVKSYEPYGEVLSSTGNGVSNYGFTGEWTDNYFELVNLRSRMYSPGTGRFLTKDTWPGNYRKPLSLNAWNYVESNSINYTDPSGHFSTGFYVGIAEWFFSKEGLFHCSKIPDNGQSLNDRTTDLWFDYLCERGPEHRKFNAADYLTKELVQSVLIHLERKSFYENSNQPIIDKTVKFNTKEFGLAWIDWLALNADINNPTSLPEANITHFLGSFDISIHKDGNRVHFSVHNQTDRSSGTHFPGKFPPEYNLFLEDLINDPEIANDEFSDIVSSYPIISILAPKTRAETSDWAIPFPEGGGVMEQTFSWTEAFIPCEIMKYPYPSYNYFIDLGYDYKNLSVP